MRQPNLKGRLARWALKLQGYKFKISHRKGKDNVVPDALSRMHEGEIMSVEFVGPEVDLDSPHFFDEDYNTLKAEIMNSPEDFPDLKVIDQFVYIRTQFNTEGVKDSESWKLWIPERLRQEILKRSHASIIACHGGVAKTINLIRRCFYWPGLLADVREYIRQCDVCKMTKLTNKVLRPEMGEMVKSERPFQRFYIDLLGPYPRSKKGFIGLLIVLDHFPKYHWLCPMKIFSTDKIIHFLWENVFHVYGVPEIIVSDNGSQFKGREFNAF